MAESLHSLAASFARFLAVEGKQERTRVLYGQSITYLSAWLRDQNLPDDLSGLTRANVLGWLGSLRDRGLSDGTIRTRWRGLRRFANWLLAEQIISADPLAGITVDKPEPPPVPILTDEELALLVLACRGKTFNDRRDEAMIRLLIDCGPRVSELTGIDCKDLDLDAATVMVTGKGARIRAAYFGSKTSLALDRYLRARRDHKHAATPALFLGERGRFTMRHSSRLDAYFTPVKRNCVCACEGALFGHFRCASKQMKLFAYGCCGPRASFPLYVHNLTWL